MLTNLFDARDHLRLDDDFPDDELERKVIAAEQAAEAYVNRKLFADQDARAAAIASVAQAVTDAAATYATGAALANDVADFGVRTELLESALQVYRDAMWSVRKTQNGIVANYAIEAAVFLILGHLLENRQNVIAGDRAQAVELPQGAYHLLDPYRLFLGV